MAASYCALASLGFVIGVAGTSGHRYQPYWGSALVIGVVLSAGLFARAWKSWSGLVVFGLAWVATVLFLYHVEGPGGSVVILGDTLGKVWLYGGVIAAILPAFAPRRLVSEAAPVGRMVGSNSPPEETP